jgi:hypothetical protein
MSRTSNNEYDASGFLTAGFDYANQAWVSDGLYVDCSHPETMACGCYGRAHADEPCRYSNPDANTPEETAQVIAYRQEFAGRFNRSIAGRKGVQS